MSKRQTLFALAGDKHGATTVEYALILGLIVLAMLAGFSSLADGTSGLWSNVDSRASSAMSGTAT